VQPESSFLYRTKNQLSRSQQKMSSVISSAKSTEAEPTAIARLSCLCGKPVYNNKLKCSDCNYVFCSKKCLKKLFSSHPCAESRQLDHFLRANSQFLHHWGMWLKCHSQHNWIGVHIEIAADGASIVKTTPLDLPSVSNLIARAKAPMLNNHYPEAFQLFISWKKVFMLHKEMDLNVHGSIFVNADPKEKVYNEASRFLISPKQATEEPDLRTEQWFKKLQTPCPMARRIELPYDSFVQWKTKSANKKGSNEGKTQGEESKQ
jgi:hypothetical protein